MSPDDRSAATAASSQGIGALLSLAKQGDADAAQALFARYRPYLRVKCALQLPALCQRREDASDIVQHTLLDAARALGGLRGTTEAEFEMWMTRLLERNVLQSIRRHTADKRDIRRETIDWRPADSAQLVWHSMVARSSLPEDSVIRGEAALQLAQALDSLPDDQRTAVELRYLGQHSLKFIAEFMEKTSGAVAGLIRRGVENLRSAAPPESSS